MNNSKNINTKLVGLGTISLFVLIAFMPLSSAMGCHCRCDPNSWVYNGHWEQRWFKVYVSSPWWHGLFRGHIDGLDENGYYYWEYEWVWVIDWTGLMQ